MPYLKKFKIKRLTKKLMAMHKNRGHTQPSDEILAKEIAYYNQLADIYHSLLGNKHYPYATEMEKECLRAAAALNDAESQFRLAAKLLGEAKLRDKLEHEELFANNSNKLRMQQLYEEVHAYLLAAERLGHIHARRLRGLCYINGWGVDVAKDKGFELVVKSIEQENSWDKVPQIFAEIGLNKPEFFAALIKHRNKS